VISSDEGLLIEDQNAGEHTLYGAVKEVRTPPPKPDPTRMLWRLLGCFADREEQTFSPIWEKRWTEGGYSDDVDHSFRVYVDQHSEVSINNSKVC
jgi:hypothetical protein